MSRDVLAEATVVGQESRNPPHDYAETREAAMAAFAKSWRRG
jgi:hypothetical protein